MTPSSTRPATTSVCDRTSCACRSNFGDVLIFLRRIPTDSDRTDHFPFENNGNAALQRRRSGQSQSSYATVADLIFKDFAWPSENCRGARLADSNLHAGNLSVVQSLEQQQMSAIIHDGDYNRRATLFCFGLRRRSDFPAVRTVSTFFTGNCAFTAAEKDNDKASASRKMRFICSIGRGGATLLTFFFTIGRHWVNSPACHFSPGLLLVELARQMFSRR